jgi:hypothetical protein
VTLFAVGYSDGIHGSWGRKRSDPGDEMVYPTRKTRLDTHSTGINQYLENRAFSSTCDRAWSHHRRWSVCDRHVSAGAALDRGFAACFSSSGADEPDGVFHHARPMPARLRPGLGHVRP